MNRRISPGTRMYWNDDWKFLFNYDEGMLRSGYADDKMESIRLPHTVTETPFHYFDEAVYQTVSGYRRVFAYDESWRGKKVLITVEAAAHEACLYLNGKQVISHSCGYTAFTADLTPYLNTAGENVLVIKVDSRESLNTPPFGNVIDYMTYGGIYREIYIDVVNPSYIKDVFARIDEVVPDGSGASGDVTVCCLTETEGSADSLVHRLTDSKGNCIELKPDANGLCRLSGVALWSNEKPVLYTLRTELYDAGVLQDAVENRIGFRKVEARTDGIYINGRKIKLRGLNRHQSYPYIGYAMPKSIQQQDADILKYELGLNAVRTSHYPHSHHFIDRCDELGLLVFTEIPGWQHIGDSDWKSKAVANTRDMVIQYRNHPSIILWGVRINESLDDDEFYAETNAAAHELDPTRPTSGVRYLQKSSLLEDVYAYNDFSHDGSNHGCMPKKKVTPDTKKAYLISESNGHMFPTKSFDCEEHRTEHLIRHAKVMDGWYGEDDIAGGFSWCMSDYNTHKDFGSGDRICYHGVTDMFRNHKPAAAVYAAQEEYKTVLEIPSSMDIGEHPACLMKDVYAVTNADSVRLYKNGLFVAEFDRSRTPFKNMPHGPILIDDFIGELLEKGEGFSHKKAEDVKKILLAANKYGLAHLPLRILLLAAKCMVFRGMKMQDAVRLYNKYVGNWGGTVTTYRFDAVKNGKTVASVSKEPVREIKLQAEVSHKLLKEENTYDVAAIRLKAVDGAGNVLPFCQEVLRFEVSGELGLIGPEYMSLRGGMGGTYVKSTGRSGSGTLIISGDNIETIEIIFQSERG